MGWQDAPVVEDQPAWMQAPEVGSEPAARKGPTARYTSPTSPSFGQQVGQFARDTGRQLGLTARYGIEGAASLGTAVANVPAYLANRAMDVTGAVGGPQTDFRFPEQGQNLSNVLTRLGLPEPQTTGEKVVGFGSRVVAGAMVPLPKIPGLPEAPAGFVPKMTEKQRVFSEASDAGLVVPPSQVNPTVANRVLEGASGKIQTAQLARSKNTGQITALVAEDLGIPAGEPITRQSLAALRSQAEQLKAPIRQAGEMPIDDTFRAAIDKALQKSTNKSFSLRPNAAAPDLESLVKNDSFDANDALDAIAKLRESADEAFSNRAAGTGRAYKAAADALEAQIERNLTARGKDGAELLQNYRAARTLQAKAFSAGKALSGGDIDATKLLQQLKRGAPLSGNMKLAAEFADNFPKAAKPLHESMPGWSPLDLYGAAGASVLSGNPSPLLFPIARVGARHALLSGAMQGAAAETLPYQFSDQVIMGLGALPGSVRGQ